MPDEEKNKSEETKTESAQHDTTTLPPPDDSEEILRYIIQNVKHIERVLDVNLELRVKIGTLNMKLRDVLQLGPGAIIEIERDCDAPLELSIGDKVLATGEVVTVGENLGLRIIKKDKK